MAQPVIRYVGMDYFDRTGPLKDGSVQPEGLTLQCLPMTHGRFGGFDDWPDADAVELSVSKYLSGLAQGDRRAIALPIFPSRAFRLDGIYLRADGDVAAPRDLVGRRVGISDYERTAALWQRGILTHEYGVRPEDLSWLQSSPLGARPPNVSVSVVGEGQTMGALLAAGEIDAIFHGAEPPVLPAGAGGVRRLFPRWIDTERDYYARTGIFPIMHVVALRREVYERDPWIAPRLVAAFERAKAVGWQRVVQANTPAVMLPWLSRDLAEIEDVFGADHWPYGIGPNYPTLDATCQFHFEQGLSSRRLQPEELFAPATLGGADG
jgi:4,5-dihydroxyphthalate decarboxylase